MIGELSAVPTLKELAADQEWWVRRNACQALANMGPEGEKALVDLLMGEDRYARDRAAATLEARGATRRAIRNLARPGKRGEKARALVAALIGAGATRHIKNLAGGLPEGEERRVLRELLGEDERETGEVLPSETGETVGREP